MLTKFWETFGSKMAENWVARVLTPAFAFWAGGLVAINWDNAREAVGSEGWDAIRRPAAELGSLPVVAQGALVLGLLAGLALSALVADRATVPLLRLLEGYWPAGRPRWLRNRLIERHADQRDRDQQRFSELFGRRLRGGLTPGEYSELLSLKRQLRGPTAKPRSALYGWVLGRLGDDAGGELEQAQRRYTELDRKRTTTQLTPAETGELARLELRLRRTPVSRAITMPTRLGNLLRAAEERPNRKYGLDTVAVWPQFWLVLPQDTRDELIRGRMGLEAATRGWLWAALFAVWTPLAAWALPVSVVVATALYYGSMLNAAELYGDLIEASFDVHRAALYRAVRWPLSPTTDDDPLAGAELSQYLWRGTAPRGMKLEQHRDGPSDPTIA
jgi:hypothetical protein